MEETKKSYYWVCPECKEEQKVISDYFARDCTSSEKCRKCGKRVSLRHPASPYDKKNGEVIAYIKE